MTLTEPRTAEQAAAIAQATAMFDSIRLGQPHPDLDRLFPFYPLTAPGMPLPGPDFEQAAVQLGDATPIYDGTGRRRVLQEYGHHLHYLYRRALYDSDFVLRVTVKGQPAVAPFVPGHLFGQDAADFGGGPRQARVMIIGQCPGYEEVQRRANLVGETSVVLHDALGILGVSEEERATWYVTNLIKFPQLDQQSDAIPTAWKQDCAILLAQELRLVRPDYILCLGSHACKHLLGPEYGVNNMLGRVEPYMIPLADNGEAARYHQAKVMAIMHPAAVYRRPEEFDSFKDQLGLFLQLAGGADVGARERTVKHVNVYKYSQLRRIVDRIRSDPNPDARIIAIDGEWDGTYPTEPGAYLRTVQFSNRHGEAYCVVLRHQGGAPAFVPSIEHGLQELRRLLQYDPEANWYPQVGGHFLRADLPWLIYNGIDLRREYCAAPTAAQMRTSGGWDTSLAYHAVNETASYDLADMTVRLTTAPRYDIPLARWKTAYCAARKIKAKELEGYGNCPSWILHPEPYEEYPNYACYDADVTRRIIKRCYAPGGLLDHDWFGQNSWEPYWISHRASLGFLEMEMSGLTLDRDRMDELVRTFCQARDALLANFQRTIHWPDFNPKSTPQCTAFLFGDTFATRKGPDGQPVAIRPEGATTLNLMPIKTTGRRSKLWAAVVARGETAAYRPSTDKEVLGILGQHHPLAMRLRDLKFIMQVLQGALRPPDEQEDAAEDGNFEYSEGMAAVVHADGKVRTHLSQNKETGRASSYRPPLQNLTKRREGDYSRILGYWKVNKKTGERTLKGDYPDIFPEPLYQHPIRSIFRASPGYALVECDLKGAELAVIAWLSGDANMIEHVRRNNLEEDDPEYYDIHSQQAVRAFRLDCPPTKSGLQEAGLSPKRVAAKNVNFGRKNSIYILGV